MMLIHLKKGKEITHQKKTLFSTVNNYRDFKTEIETNAYGYKFNVLFIAMYIK